MCLFTSQESTLLSPQCSLKVGRLLYFFLQQCVHACVCVSSVCPEISHRNFLITQNQAAFWVSVVPPTAVFVWHWICIHTHIHTCTHSHRLRGTPESLKNEAVFSLSRYKAFVRRSNCQAERKPTAFLALCPKFK